MTKHRQQAKALNEIVVHGRIAAFLSGQTDGRDVFSALYGSVGDEPVPERLRAIVWRAAKTALEEAA